ncbi:hypothetical protein CGMCC3_g7589 [Colletotrichum fructicola]|nr:uncharacterized protein CGMCC3_g7589 [Colletotrichum fructicola]KAE9576651.1 hypothetical protein CGMCC3_g7589 [Colletotrichum fructicola]
MHHSVFFDAMEHYPESTFCIVHSSQLNATSGGPPVASSFP